MDSSGLQPAATRRDGPPAPAFQFRCFRRPGGEGQEGTPMPSEQEEILQNKLDSLVLRIAQAKSDQYKLQSQRTIVDRMVRQEMLGDPFADELEELQRQEQEASERLALLKKQPQPKTKTRSKSPLDYPRSEVKRGIRVALTRKPK